MKLLGISGTIVGSKTAITVNQVLEEVKKNYPEVEVELLDLRQYNIDFCDGRDPSAYTGDTKLVMDKIASSDFFLIGTPIFQASLSGVLKNLFDLLPVDTFRDKVMGFVATGGTYQHYLVIENQLKPIASYFRAYIEPNQVYLHTNHFNSKNEIVDEEVKERLQRLAHGLVFMHKQLNKSAVMI
ncbi:NADPH-dependent FMN reductase [Bacillus sp. EB600]|uniref:NADPH-dependent FMN reductase n=1 Tax=Bacillus sp. EB600 TaxID=2806345 RepID=UPI00210E865B|nr:NAD(P)H-dependent oxidoreductase [Bacillus sp. EB600]MCQ6282422.1 NAD(P)H-dependent oxidoreductase [Bacillus sp. EB600]